MKKEQGVALVLVLWILVLLSVIAGQFCYTIRIQTNITRNFKEQTQAYYIAQAGLQAALTELIKQEVLPFAAEEEAAKGGKKEGEEEKASETEEPVSWRINTVIPPIRFGQGEFEVKIDNESGKVNINTADARMLRVLLDSFDLEEHDKEVIVDSILDWRDPDDLHRLNGAEDDYYRSLPEPYESKDGDFDSVEELLLVKGVTRDIFYGGLKDMVTAYGGAKPKGMKGRKTGAAGRININAASPQILLTLPEMTQEIVDEVVTYRKEKDFETMSDVSAVVGPEVFNAISPNITLNVSPYYEITSTGVVGEGGTRSRIRALVRMDATMEKRYRIVKWIDGFEMRPANR